MSVGNSISENQIESDSDLEDDLFSLAKDDNDVFSDSDDEAYLLVDESLKGTLDASFKSFPCTYVSTHTQCKNVGSRCVPQLDPGADLLSSRVPDPSDKWEEIDDFGSFCIFDEMPLEPCDNEVILSSPTGFDGSSTDAVDYAEGFLRRHSTLEHLLSAKLPDECDNANSIWSILTNKLLYCQSDTSDSVRHFSYDSLKAKNAKQRFFHAALNNEPCLDTAYINSCNAAELKELLFDAANLNVPNKKTLNTAEATASSNMYSHNM